MSNESGFNWKYLIPGYGIYLIKQSEIPGKGHSLKKTAQNTYVTGLMMHQMVKGKLLILTVHHSQA